MINKRILLPVLFSFVMFSIAYAGQLTSTNTSLYFFEDSNEVKMANGVIGIIAYTNKGLEQNKPTYFTGSSFTDAKANEEIYLEEFKNGEWKKVNFAHYTAVLNEEAHTITKKYWNNLQESLDIVYTLNDFNSPAKLSFNLWGFSGTYRIQWRVSEINTNLKFEQNNKIAYVDNVESNETNEPMSNIPITIDPPETFPEDYEIMINYNDLIEAVGYDKVSSTTEYNEDGTVQATTFILGDFSMQFWEVLELDPQITTGHTNNQIPTSFNIFDVPYLCYQESANVSNQTSVDGNCGQVYTGAYSVTGFVTNVPNWYNGNWADYMSGTTNAYAYVNYTIPSNIRGAVWNIEYAGAITNNLTIPLSCLAGSKLQLRAEFVLATTTWNMGCYSNYSTWLVMKTYVSATERVYEESINWIQDTGINRYYISVHGDPENNADDTSYILTSSNFSNGSSWTYTTSSKYSSGYGGYTFAMRTADGSFHNIIYTGDDLYSKQTMDGLNWGAVSSISPQDYWTFPQYKEPRWITTNQNVSLFTSIVSSNVYVMRYNASSGNTWQDISYGAYDSYSIYFDELYNITYLPLKTATNTIYLLGSTNSFLSQTFNIFLDNKTWYSNPMILEYDNDLYIIDKNLTSSTGIIYHVCNSTERADYCFGANDWDEGNPIVAGETVGFPFSLNAGITSADNNGIFIFPYGSGNDTLQYFIFADDIWFRLKDLVSLGISNNVSQRNGWQHLIANYNNATDKINMVYGDYVGGYEEVFTHEYSLPEIVVKLWDSRTNTTILTNQTVSAYCGSTFMKNTSTITGSIAIYPEDYTNAGCSTNSTTIQLVANDFKETNMTVTNDNTLDGYILTADITGWNISAYNKNCNATYTNGWYLYATNGTTNVTKNNSLLGYTNPTQFTIGEIGLTGNINFTINQSNTSLGSYKAFENNEEVIVCSPISDSKIIYSYVSGKQVRNVTVEVKKNATNSHLIYAYAYYMDGTSDTNSWSINASALNTWYNYTFPSSVWDYNKTVKYFRFQVWTNDNCAWMRYKGAYFNTQTDSQTIQTTPPSNNLTNINAYLDNYVYYNAIDRRSSNANKSYWYLTMNNATFTNTSQANIWQVTKLTSQLPFGSSTYMAYLDAYNNSYLTQTTNCHSFGYTFPLETAGLELRVKDEETQAYLTYNVTIRNSTDIVEFENQVSSASGQFWNASLIPNGDITITVKNASGGYEQRDYTATMSSTTFLNLTAYLLNDYTGLIRNFHVVDSTGSPLANSIVKIYRFIDGDWTLVSSKTADDSGTASFLMNPSEPYQVVAWYYEGVTWYSSPTYAVTPSLSDYTITIGITIGSAFHNIFDTVAYQIQPSGFALPKSNSTTINFTVSCTSGDLEWFAYYLTDQNGTYLTSGNMTTTSGGKLTATIDTTNLTKVYGNFSILRTGFSTWETTRNYIVYNYGYGNYSFFAFLTNTKNDSSIPDLAKNIVVIFVAIGIMAGIMSLGVGAFGSGLVGMAFITMTAVFGWFSFPAIIVMWFILVGYLVLMRGYG